MALSIEEQEKVNNYTFSYELVYQRIVKFYKTIAADWQFLSVTERIKYSPDPNVDITLTFAYINSLPDESDDLFFVLDFVHLVKSSKDTEKLLEFAYHIKDENGIKLGMYAEYLLRQFEIVASFK